MRSERRNEMICELSDSRRTSYIVVSGGETCERIIEKVGTHAGDTRGGK